MTALLLTVVLAQGPVSVSLVDGSSRRGKVVSMGAGSLVLRDGPKTERLPLETVQRIDFAPPVVAAAKIRVRTVDGSRFGAAAFTSDGKSAAMKLPNGRPLSLPIEKIAALLTTSDPHEAAEWPGRSVEQRRADLLSIARDDKRLLLEGTVGAVGEDKLVFTFEGEDLPIRRERVRAIYFSQRTPATEPGALATGRNGDVWVVADWKWNDRLELTSSAGAAVKLPLAELASLDFAPSRLTYLSDLDPNVVRHEPAFDVPFRLGRDSGPGGRPLRLEGRRLAKGLAVHSQTLVEYDVAGRYKSLQSMVGIDEGAGSLGDADVRILADGRKLWEERVQAGRPPKRLSLDLAGVARLTLEVRYGAGLDLGDLVVFGEARLVK